MGISMKTTSGKILASVALVGTAAAVAGMGTYGAFTSTTTASAGVDAGTVSIALDGAPNSSLNLPVSGLLPGDTVERLVNITNTGTSDLSRVSLTTDAGKTASALTVDTETGLQMAVEKCSVAWTGNAAPYKCSGTMTNVLAKSPIIGANRVFENLAALKVKGVDNLKFTATLHKDAPNTSQGAASTITFTFDAMQRAEMYK